MREITEQRQSYYAGIPVLGHGFLTTREKTTHAERGFQQECNLHIN